MLKYNFNRILQLRGVKKPYTFLIRHGFPGNYAANMIKGKHRHLRNDYLEHFCLLMRCTPNDLIDWEPDTGSAIDNAHPMRQLIRGHETANMSIALRTAPLERLIDIFGSIETEEKGEAKEEETEEESEQ